MAFSHKIRGSLKALFTVTIVSLVAVLVMYKVTHIPTKGISGENLSLQSVAETLQAKYNVLHRIHLLNTAIEIARQEEMYSVNDSEWQQVYPATKIRLIHGKSDVFLDMLSNVSQIITFTLPWFKDTNSSDTWSSLNDSSNFLVQKYYDWVATDPLCRFMKTPGISMNGFKLKLDTACHRDPKLTTNPISLPAVSLFGVPIDGSNPLLEERKTFPDQLYRKPPDILTYMHMIQHGLIVDTGEVYRRDIKIVPNGCLPNSDINPPASTSNIPLFSEVFVISQYWGKEVFHRMVEDIPRISVFLEFLRRNSHIVIHSPTDQGTFVELLELLGISKFRLVTGMIRAKIVYLPRATRCGYSNALEIQLLSTLYRNYIKTNLRNTPRDKIVLIRRSHSRRFTEQQRIEEVVRSVANSYGLRYSLFSDNPTPSLNETMVLFQSAVMVVAPHGAGLSNVIFSEPGTVVIEGVCNPPHANLCYLTMTFILGHRWHGIPSRKGCERVVDVSASVINETIAQYLDSRVIELKT